MEVIYSYNFHLLSNDNYARLISDYSYQKFHGPFLSEKKLKELIKKLNKLKFISEKNLAA